jgi:drug/metabolite transporter (DMT)-like permease
MGAQSRALKPPDPDQTMTLTGFLLVLAAAFCHAIWNFHVKRMNAGPELVWLFSAVGLVLYGPLAAYFLWTEGAGLGWIAVGMMAASSFVHLAYFLLLQRGYRVGDLSLIYPIARSTGPLLSTTFAVAVLGEHMTLQTGLGGLLIIGGVICLSGGFGAGNRHLLPSIGFGIVVGMFIGTYTVLDAYAVSVILVPPVLLDYGTMLGRVIILAPLAARRRDSVRSLWREQKTGVMVVAIFSPLAYILVLYALTFTPVIYVAPLRETSVLIGVFLGSILLSEGHLKKRMIWASVIMAGVAVLASG